MLRIVAASLGQVIGLMCCGKELSREDALWRITIRYGEESVSCLTAL
ncbi:MAG TPA: hypothetical protein VIM43_03760 [Rugosibacter sp.]